MRRWVKGSDPADATVDLLSLSDGANDVAVALEETDATFIEVRLVDATNNRQPIDGLRVSLVMKIYPQGVMSRHLGSRELGQNIMATHSSGNVKRQYPFGVQHVAMIAGGSDAPVERGEARELAADAAGIVGDESKVQLLVVGAATTADALKAARVVVATPKEALDAFSAYKVLGKKAAAFGAVVLDEVDALLPPKKKDYRSAGTKKRAAQTGKKKKQLTEKRQAANSPAEDVVRFVVKANPRPELQVVAASATASRATRDSLRSVLRQDLCGNQIFNSTSMCA